jgi:hypothetical protein
MFLEKTNDIILNKEYKIVPLGEDPEYSGIYGTLIYINDFFKSGKVFIFDNTQSFVKNDKGIYAFKLNEHTNMEMVDDLVQYEMYIFVNYVLK